MKLVQVVEIEVESVTSGRNVDYVVRVDGKVIVGPVHTKMVAVTYAEAFERAFAVLGIHAQMKGVSK